MKPAMSFATAALCAALLLLPPAAAAELVPPTGSPFAAGSGPFSVTLADLGGAPGPDVVIADELSDDVTVLLGTAGGGFTPAPGSPYPAGDRPSDVAVADFDGDGGKDLAVANFGDDTVSLLLRGPSGGWSAADGGPLPVGAAPSAIAARDFNGDQLADLAVVDQNAHAVSVLLRDPDGGFDEEDGSPVPTGGSSPFDLAVADLDGDGRPDLAVTEQASDDAAVLLRRPGGGFAPAPGSPYPVGSNPIGIYAADLDGDGRPELATANRDSDDLTVLRRVAGGGFAPLPGSPFAAGDAPYGVAAADLNRDGRRDLAVSDETPGAVTALIRGPLGGFATGIGTPVPAGAHPLRLAAADLNGDGRPDLVVPNYSAGTVSVLANVPDTTLTAQPPAITDNPTPSFAFESSDPTATFECRLDGGAFTACAAPHTTAALPEGEHAFAVRAIDAGGNPDPTPATASFRVQPAAPPATPAAGQPPVNTVRPRIVPAHPTGFYTCDPGQWTGAAHGFSYRWLQWRAHSFATPPGWDVVATTQIYAPERSVLPYVCEVTAHNKWGLATATSDALAVGQSYPPPTVYGNIRVRGIDVFQTTQPASGASMFGFPSGAFFGYPGGGTPTAYEPIGLGNWLPPGANAQHIFYDGVTLDAVKPTTVVVYVDVSDVQKAGSPSLPIDVTLRPLVNGKPVADLPAMHRTIRNLPHAATPWVELGERNSPRYGVQFAIPPSWLRQGVDLRAHAGFVAGASIAEVTQCAVGKRCSADDTFRLDDLAVASLPGISIEPVRLNRSVASPQSVLERARQIYPGGGQSNVFPYQATLDVGFEEGVDSKSPFCLLFKDVRSCRHALVTARVAEWSARHQSATSDVVMGVHSYPSDDASSELEGGWTTARLGGLAAPGQSLLHTSGAMFFADGGAKRPLTAAAHEYGHVLGLPHAGQLCGGNANGQIGEPWSPVNDGGLGGVKWDRTRLDSAGDVIPNAITIGDHDLMSYCARENHAWLSARNWNHSLDTLRHYTPRTQAGAARAATASGGGQAFAVGVVGPRGGRVLRVNPPQRDAAIPAPVPSSPLRLRALDGGGHPLREVRVAVVRSSEATDAGTFVGPVPPSARAVELVRDGEVLDRIVRTRPPSVRVLAPRRGARARTRGTLAVRWRASDPDGGRLHASIDSSADGGRHWRTVFEGPSRGRARILGRDLEGSRRARVRVTVSDGFASASARSRTFRAEGTAPIVQIVSPLRGDRLRFDEPALLTGSAFDDRRHALHRLTWFAGRRRLGTGKRLRAKLPAGRYTLRLIGRDARGRAGNARVRIVVAQRPLRVERLNGPFSVRHGARRATIAIRTSIPATLRIAGRRHQVGPRARRLRVRLPRQPTAGLLHIRYTVTTGGRRIRGAIALVRA